MAYTVKITSTIGKNTIIESAGLRGDRTILSISNARKTVENSRPKKIHGWQTISGAMHFIESAKKDADGWYRKYEVISDDLEMLYDYLNETDAAFESQYGFRKELVNFEL